MKRVRGAIAVLRKLNGGAKGSIVGFRAKRQLSAAAQADRASPKDPLGEVESKKQPKVRVAEVKFGPRASGFWTALEPRFQAVELLIQSQTSKMIFYGQSMNTSEAAISFRELLAYTDYLANRWVDYFGENSGALDIHVGGKTGSLRTGPSHLYGRAIFANRLLQKEPPVKLESPTLDDLIHTQGRSCSIA